MINKLTKLTADLLDLASDRFSNHGCNDLDEKFFKDWSDEEKLAFLNLFWSWCDPEMLEDGVEPDDIKYVGDSALMSFLAFQLGGK